ncbi:prolipoprotein diacylglyceryl transferase [Corynebacterium auriscanis]|uniref:hypothetical protein n=1 Tax=Corynebacterium auriscanis TaxID=99807 RepID=UPI00224621D0|nr:hypothetical protein [Corynebacterium auriscanis]MCX2163689.1 hypothetical protein [Corynebacterium auriscanis]
MKIRRTVATAVIAGLSAASLNGVATAAPTPAPVAQNAPATADEPAATTDAEEPGKTEKPGETKKPGEPNEVVGSIADLLAYLPGLLPGDSEAAGSAEGAELPQDLEQLAGSASELLSSGDSTATPEPSTGEGEADAATSTAPSEGEADAADATGQAKKPDAATSTAPSEDADEDSALGTDSADKPEGAERAGAQGAANGGGTAGTANGGGTAGAANTEGAKDADKVTVPAADTKPVSGDAKAAAERVIEEQETKAGHDLVEVNFVDDKTAFISLAESFDQQADADALKEIAQALHDNGFTVTAERSAK